MSKNLQLSLTMMFNGSAVTTGLDGVKRKIIDTGNGADTARRKFNEWGNSGKKALSDMNAKAKELHASLNGFGIVSQVAGAYAAMAGANSMKSVIDDNLAFERLLLKIKFNAQATTKELAEMRKASLDLSKGTLNTPLEMLQMHQRFANAGMKSDDIKQLAPVVAKVAQVFDAPAMEIADMVFDMITKTGIEKERVPQMMDMLYFHATSGRFETMDMAKQAPLLLQAGKNVGLDNEKGLNLLGALTQRLMRNTTVQNPSEVAVMAQHGLSDISSPHYVKGLKNVGIDLKSFFDDKGHFKGEGGVDGILALVKAMKKKGLDNPFKLGEAGFREQHTRTFWLELMRSLDAKDTDKDPNLLGMMKRGKEAADSDQLAKNLIQTRESNFGKIKGAEIERQKAALSKPAGAFTSAVSSVVGWASDNIGTAAVGALGLAVAGRLGYKGLEKKMAGGAGSVAGSAAGALGVQKVFVTNFPSSMQSPVDALKDRRSRMPDKSGAASITTPAKPAVTKMGQFLGGMKGTLKYGAPLAAMFGLAEAGMIAADSDMDADSKKREYKRVAGGTVGSVAGSVIGGAIGGLFGGFGAIPGAMIGGSIGNWGGEKLMAMFDKINQTNKTAIEEISRKPAEVNVNVKVENGNIVAEVDKEQQRQAIRK